MVVVSTDGSGKGRPAVPRLGLPGLGWDGTGVEDRGSRGPAGGNEGKEIGFEAFGDFDVEVLVEASLPCRTGTWARVCVTVVPQVSCFVSQVRQNRTGRIGEESEDCIFRPQATGIDCLVPFRLAGAGGHTHATLVSGAPAVTDTVDNRCTFVDSSEIEKRLCTAVSLLALHRTRIAAAGTTVSASVSSSSSRSGWLSIGLSCCSRFGFLEQEFLASRIPCQASTVFLPSLTRRMHIFLEWQAGRRAGYGCGCTPQRGQPRTPLSFSPDHTVPVLDHYGTMLPAPPTKTVPVLPHPHAP